MRKGRMLLLLVALATVLVFVGSFLGGSREPSYAGRPLSYWLEAPESTETETAIRAIGTNAIPFLLKSIRYEPPTWLYKLASILPIPSGREQIYLAIDGGATWKAMTGFGILGTNAVAAIPVLVSIMKDPAHPQPATRAIFALSSIGDDALPYLAAELSDPSQSNKTALVFAIFSMAHTVGTNACLPLLLKATGDQDPRVRSNAANAIRRLTPTGVTNAPVP